MVDIPEHLLQRSAEARAKALGVPIEQVLAEMRGEAPPPSAPPPSATPTPATPTPSGPAAVVEAPAPEDPDDSAGKAPDVGGDIAETDVTESAESTEPVAEPEPPMGEPEVSQEVLAPAPALAEPPPAAEIPAAAAGGGDAPLAASVSPRPVVQPEAIPEGVRTQRLLTVVKARAIQQVKSSPADKVNTWPHLMIAEFTALLVMTGFLIILSVILQAPLLELANFNATPNPSKAPWYFLGLQELLSYYDPQIAGVIVPGISGLIGFMAIPFIDRNPSTKPSDRKFAILLFTFFLAGSATLTMLGTLFRGPGFNFTYPWADGIWFDDLKDWVNFE